MGTGSKTLWFSPETCQAEFNSIICINWYNTLINLLADESYWLQAYINITQHYEVHSRNNHQNIGIHIKCQCNINTTKYQSCSSYLAMSHQTLTKILKLFLTPTNSKIIAITKFMHKLNNFSVSSKIRFSIIVFILLDVICYTVCAYQNLTLSSPFPFVNWWHYSTP